VRQLSIAAVSWRYADKPAILEDDEPVILEDDESDTPAALGLSKPTNPSGYELWYNVEDQRFVDEDLCPFPPLEQEGLALTPTPTQDQSHSCHHSTRLSQDQIS